MKKKASSFYKLLLCLPIGLFLLVACQSAQEPGVIEVTRVVTETETVTEQIEVTRVVEGEVVTEIQEVEVTRVVEAAPAVLADDIENIVIAVQSLPPTLGPGSETGDHAVRITYNIFDKLIEYDFENNMELRPGLAVSWERIDDQTLEIKLREGVLFHNGDEMTAEDVAFTFSLGRRESEGPRRLNQYWSNLETIEIIDDYTLRFSMNHPDPILEQRFGIWTGDIVNKRAYEAAPEWNEWARNPVGTGPFSLKEFGSDRIVLEAFKDHYLGAPTVETITFIEVPEVAARVAGLVAGDYHLVTDVPPDLIATVEKYDDLEVVGGPVLSHRVLVFNQGENANPIMQDVHLRRAMSLAIDREILAETLWQGRTSVPTGLQWPEFGNMYVDREGPVYDPDLAREELAQSNYNGEAIFYPMLNNYYINEMATAEVLIEMWAEVGINVELAIKENWGQITGGAHDVRNFSTTMVYPDPAAAIWRLFQPSVVERRGWGFDNDVFFGLGQDVLDVNPDEEARRQALAEMMEIWETEDPMGAILYQNAIFYGKRTNLSWTPYQAAYMDFGPLHLQQ